MRLAKYLKPVLIVGDFVAVNVAMLLAVVATGDIATSMPSKWVWLLLNVAFAFAELVLPVQRKFRFLYIDRTLLDATKLSVTGIMLLAALLYISNMGDVSLLRGVLMAALTFSMLATWRIIAHFTLKKYRRMGLNYRRVVVVGSGLAAQSLYDELTRETGFGQRLMAFFDDDREQLARMPGAFHGTMDDFEPFVRLNDVDLIYYTLNAANHERITSVMALAEELGVEFIYVPGFSRLLTDRFQPIRVGSLPAMRHSFTPLEHAANKILKRILDLCVAVPFLLVSPVIFIPIAIAIKISSPGPVFFRQKRTGIHGTEFVCYKFRTMRVNADSDKVQATEDDPRKTRFGDFLRRSSMDELPQFFNVFLGNMSVVGPRPHMVSHTEEYMQLIDRYMIRHAVKPGITGWAQVNGYRGGTKHLWQMEKRVEYDVWYICNWNFFLDLKIILMTALNGLRGDKNAY